MQTNPHLLEPIIQSIAQGNPQFAALINQNPEGFFQLLAEGAGGPEGGALPPGAIQVTPEEAEAIGRVSFPKMNLRLTGCSWKHWGFLDIWLFKRTLHAIKMRRLLRIIYLNMDLMMTTRMMPLQHNLPPATEKNRVIPTWRRGKSV